MNAACRAAIFLTLGLVCAACRTAPYESRRVWADVELTRVEIADTSVMARRLPDGAGRHEVPVGPLARGAALVRVGVASASAARVEVGIAGAAEPACRLDYPRAAWRTCRIAIPAATEDARLVVRVHGKEDVRTAVSSPLLRADGAPRLAPVLVLLLDTLRFDRLASYRREFPVGQALAELGRDGVVFEHAYSSSSWTRTAVATLLTGLVAATHGVFGRSDVLSEDIERLPEIFQRAGYCTAAWSTNPNVLPLWGFMRGFDAFTDLGAVHWADAKKTDARVVVARALRALDEHADFPCLYYLHFMDPHPPYTPTPDDLATVERLALGDTAPGPLSPEQGREYEKYLAEITGMDRAIGDLARGLKTADAYDGAAILVVSDHGEEFHDHGGLGHGHTLYEELLRVPALLKLPGNARARTREAREVGMADLAPTLLAALGLPALAGADGRSIWAEQPARPPTAILRLDGHRQAAIVADRRKLIVDEKAGEQLYDLRADPREQKNLAPAEATDLAALRALLLSRLALRGAGWHLRACAGARDATLALHLEFTGDGHLALAEADDRLRALSADGARRSMQADLVLPVRRVPHVALGAWREREVRDSDEVVLVTPEASGVTVRAASGEPLRYALGTEATRRTAPVLRLDAAAPGVEVAPTTAVECHAETAPPEDPLPYVRIWHVRPSAALGAADVSPEVQERLRTLGYQW